MKMACTIVDDCCYCIPLSVGTILLGLIYIAWQIFDIIVFLNNLTWIKNILPLVHVVLASIMLLLVVLMIYGSITRKRLLMLPHIFGGIIVLIFEIVSTILLFRYLGPPHFVLAMYLMMRLFIICVFCVYHFMVIYSRFGELADIEETVQIEEGV